MKAQHKRGLFWSVMGLLLVAGLMMAFWPRALVVDIAEIGSGPLASTVTEEGITRVKDIYTLSSPVDGRLQRIEAEAGDPVVAGETVIAQIEPIDPSFLDPRSEAQAQFMLRAIKRRLARCKLQLHPDKTKIVYCKDDRRPGNYDHESFDFLGYSFRPRGCKGPGYFVGFTPAVSKSAIKAMSATIKGWKLQLWSSSSLEDIARRINPVVRGWLNYYGRFYKSAMRPILRQLQHALARWAMRKYKRLKGHWLRAIHWVNRIMRRDRKLFVSWEFGL